MNDGMQKRSVVSACLYRHVMAFLDECIERGSDLEDIQTCFAETARYVANIRHEADDTPKRRLENE